MRRIENNTPKEERRKRTIYINKVKRFSRSKAWLKIIRLLAPEIADMIEAHPEYLDIPQYLNDPRLSGNYRVDIYDRFYYTGESGNLILRISEHIYNYCSSAEYFGHKFDPSIPARFEVFALHDTDKKMREFIEDKVIAAYKPVLQWTSPDDPIYGSDKPIPEGETRESMRSDICSWPNLRKERFKEIQDSYKK